MTAEVECVITGRMLPKDLAGIEGVECGFQPSSSSESRLVISGPPGSGKSSFLNSNPKLFMLDEEKGGKTVADPQAIRFTVPDDISEADRDLAYLGMVDRIIARKLKGATDIEMIGIDSYNELVETFSKALCARYNVTDVGSVEGGHGKGYEMVRQSINGMLGKIHKAGLGWAVIIHSTIDQETKQSILDVSPSFRGPIHRKCEHYLWITEGTEYVPQPSEYKVVRGKKLEIKKPDLEMKGRFILTCPGGLWNNATVSDLKARVPLPESIRLPRKGGWQAYTAAYNFAVEELVKGSNGSPS